MRSLAVTLEQKLSRIVRRVVGDTFCSHCLKGRHGSGNKGNFESGQKKIKPCSYILIGRQCNPLFVTMDTSSKFYFQRDTILQLRTSNSSVGYQLPKLYFQRDNIVYQQQLCRLPPT